MRFTVSALVLGLMVLPAMAFQETTVGGKPGSAPAAPPAASFDLPGKPEISKGLQIRPGTEIKVPGFGTVGVLPKLDFGLELLYGATDPKTPVPDNKSEPDDFRLRGTLKHRF